MTIGYAWRKALEARRVLKSERHPFHDDGPREAAASLGDKCVGFVVVAILLFMVAEWMWR